MKLRLLIGIAAGSAALAFAALALAAERAPTDVTIKGTNGDYHGRIDSPKLQKCVKERKVNVYKQKGTHQNPSEDQKIGSDTASIKNEHGVWSAGNTGFKHGKFYARAGRTTDCKAGHSQTISR
jgi:hypothetical protein